MTSNEHTESAARLLAVIAAWPDAFATRDERAAWLDKQAELFDEIASTCPTHKEQAAERAAIARATARTLRAGKRGELNVIGDPSV